MAEMVDSCCISSSSSSSMTVQLTKPDKNNNTTANVDDAMILPAEQCDTIVDQSDHKSNNTNDTDDHRLSSSIDEDRQTNSTTNPAITNQQMSTVSTSVKNDSIEIPITYDSTMNNTNTSTNQIPPSDAYKDFSGVDTESFISTTLRNNPKDRSLLLNLEGVLQQFIQSDDQTTYQFQAMNSYERMIVHRVAAFFGLDHNVDKNGQAVVVTKTNNTRIPEFSFQKCIPEDENNDTAFVNSNTENNASISKNNEMPARRILRRHEKSLNHEHFPRNGFNDDSNNNPSSSTIKHAPSSKPYSERVSNYAETRARIFNESSNSNTDAINASTLNKSNKNNSRQHVNSTRTSYRKQHQNSSYQTRPFSYQQSQVQATTNNHIQHYRPGKTIDPSSHLLNNSTNRNTTIYPTHQVPTTNLNIGQSTLFTPMVTSNPGVGPLRQQVPASFYTTNPQQSVEYDFKQTLGGAHIYNYVPMVATTPSNFIHQQQQPPTTSQPQGPVPNQNPGLHPSALATAANNNPSSVTSQHGPSMTLPIVVHQQPSGQIQYLFAGPTLQQQTQQQTQQPQQHPPPGTNPYSMQPDGQYVQIYRPDALPINGPPPTMTTATVMDNNNNHHHHHHPYPQSAPFHHHHQHPHSISQQTQQQTAPPQQSQQVQSQQQQQQQQTQQGQLAPNQSNGLPPTAPFVRIYPTGTPANVSHPYAQGSYATNGPGPNTYVQQGTIAPGSYMIPQQTPTGVVTYSQFENGIAYSSYGPAPTQNMNGPGKGNNNNTNAASVQYAATHLSALNLQNSHEEYSTRLVNSASTRFNHPNGSTNHQPRNFIGRPLVQSPNGSVATPRMGVYSATNSYRPSRPYNSTNTDKTITSNENDSKALSSGHNQQQQNSITINNTSETISLAGPAQE